MFCWNNELSFSGKFEAEACHFLSLYGKLDWEVIGSLIPTLRLSDSRWEAAIWRVNGMTNLTTYAESFVSICNQTNVVMNQASFSEQQPPRRWYSNLMRANPSLRAGKTPAPA